MFALLGSRTTRLAVVGLGLLGLPGLVALAGCSKTMKKAVIPNRPPEVRLTAAPIDTSGRYFYSIILDWTGWDPDGRVEYFLYAVDPPSRADADTDWVQTTDNEKRLTFSAGQPDPLDPLHKAREFHTFVIKAVDNDGAAGPSVFRSFFAFTQAPTVSILTPHPSNLLIPTVTPATRITWNGQDVDGVFTIKPVRYRYKLFSQSDEIPLNTIAFNPDTIRKRYAPAFAESLGWQETSGDTTVAQFTNLTPGASYVFVVVAFDEAGAYSPVMSLNSNVLRFAVGLASVKGPAICFFNEFFNYCYLAGQYTTSTLAEVEVEIPEGTPLTINWYATATPGADMRSYRWALDITDVGDQTPRSNELTDLSHWSTPSLNVTSTVLGPFIVGGGGSEEIHRFYLEAEDNNGLKSLGIVRFVVVHPTFDKELLIVDDTRKQPDERTSSGTLAPPKGRWPSAAELDTFLYARGGVPWQGYPAGTLSPPGVFNGYSFDTLGTRIGRGDLRVPLVVLGQYKRVLWLVDGEGGFFAGGGTDLLQPQTALRYMSSPGRANSLAAYVRQGGLVWAAGGGVALTSMIPWNVNTNDGGGVEFDIEPITGRTENTPGRFMWDIPAWRCKMKVSNLRVQIERYTGRFGDDRTGSGRTANVSPYRTLPTTLDFKSSSSDPLPPLRNSSDFYQTTAYIEYIKGDNYVQEELGQAASSNQIVISQVYAGGGEPGATYKNDFVELHNRSGTEVFVNGWTLQYSSGGNAWTVIPLSGSIAGGGYYLIQMGGAGGGGQTLPTPELTSTLNMSMLGGKVILRSSTDGLEVECPPASPDTTRDLVGWGDTDCYEGRVIRVLSASLAAMRWDRGCLDNDDNLADFAIVTPTPRNSLSSRQICNVESVLDTLYIATGSILDRTVKNVVMTYYHGHEHSPVIFTGFGLWTWRRSEEVQIVDYVMDNLWDMHRGSTALTGSPYMSAEGTRSASAGAKATAGRSTLVERFNRLFGRTGTRANRSKSR